MSDDSGLIVVLPTDLCEFKCTYHKPLTMGKGKTVSFDLSEKIVFLYSHSEDDEDTMSEFGSTDTQPMLSDDDDDKEEGTLSGFQPSVAQLMLNGDLWEEEAPEDECWSQEGPQTTQEWMQDGHENGSDSCTSSNFSSDGSTSESLENWRVQAIRKMRDGHENGSDSCTLSNFSSDGSTSDAPMFGAAPAEPPAGPTPDLEESLENWRVQAMRKSASSSDDSDSQPCNGTRGTCSPTDRLKAVHEHWCTSDEAAPSSSINAQSLDVVQKVHPMIIEALLKMECNGVNQGRVFRAEPRNMHPRILSALLKLNSGAAAPV
eukprot:CAMPEP_0204092346 /NCGR_PEP_ID=MMETSP0360-20130528/189862_1 /ASSEMBLY_ACC=CAM_ASM_000342 /TAXON_ID=268821 /ORGANISM="Scrippsiella Hangoei, Strain SHTV-5" /LENGTH=317 /DNA_ID=CAMNT_0051041617 /DNA_START=89 /DNA_END=1043 /DNA_ORIENTATION=+